LPILIVVPFSAAMIPASWLSPPVDIVWISDIEGLEWYLRLVETPSGVVAVYLKASSFAPLLVKTRAQVSAISVFPGPELVRACFFSVH